MVPSPVQHTGGGIPKVRSLHPYVSIETHFVLSVRLIFGLYCLGRHPENDSIDLLQYLPDMNGIRYPRVEQSTPPVVTYTPSNPPAP